jgi:xanthine dehydrogenase YagR molybdenum-binding subunit
VVLAAMAARQTGRPVRLVLQRPQLFGPVGGRPRTAQSVLLGADEDGRLAAVEHHAVTSTSVLEDWAEPCALVTRSLYACANVATTHRLVKLNLGTPTFQRAPGEATGSFALECALDELAHALGLDPIELRLRNYAEDDPERGLPFSSKALRECYRVGAERFGWSRRQARPGALRQGPWLVGRGLASSTRPAKRSAAAVMEAAVPDNRNGRIVNGNLADYHVPVNADIAAIDIVVLPEHDEQVNALGAKGLGEVSMTGVAAAIANAVFNATGVRVRELPITLDKLLG